MFLLCPPETFSWTNTVDSKTQVPSFCQKKGPESPKFFQLQGFFSAYRQCLRRVLVMDDGNCKSSFAPPPGVIWNGAMKQVNRLGEDNFNDGQDWFLAWKKSEEFFVRQGFPPFSESPISIWTVLCLCQFLVLAGNRFWFYILRYVLGGCPQAHFQKT